MDDVYKKQLEALGIEAIRIVPGDIEKKRTEERKEISAAVMRNLMDSIEGRSWLYCVLDMCRTFTSPFVPGQPDTTAFFSGAQALGHKLLADIMIAAPEKYYMMIGEEQARKKAPDSDQLL